MTNQTIRNYQTAIFLNDFFTSNSDALYSRLTSLSIFDGNNIKFPVPSDAPREIPRMLLQSQNNIVKCELSFEKILLSWNNPQLNSDFSIPLEDIKRQLSRVLNSLEDNFTIKRVGYIKQFVFETDDLNSEITQKIIQQSEVLENLENYDLKLTYKLNGLVSFDHCNQLIIIQHGSVPNNENTYVVVTSDINTHQSENLTWSIEQAKEFITEAEDKQNVSDMYNKFFG